MLRPERIIRCSKLFCSDGEFVLHSPPILAPVDSSLHLQITEISTGLNRDNLSINNFAYDGETRGIKLNEHFLLYHPDHGDHSLYSFNNSSLQDSISKPMNRGSKIIFSCVSQLVSNLVLFACSDGSIYAILVQSNRQKKLKLLNDIFVDKEREIQYMYTHSVLPFLFVAFGDGKVLIFNYEKLVIATKRIFYETEDLAEIYPTKNDDTVSLPHSPNKTSHLYGSFLEFCGEFILPDVHQPSPHRSIYLEVSVDQRKAAIILDNKWLVIFDISPLLAASKNYDFKIRHVTQLIFKDEISEGDTISLELVRCAFHPALPILFLYFNQQSSIRETNGSLAISQSKIINGTFEFPLKSKILALSMLVDGNLNKVGSYDCNTSAILSTLGPCSSILQQPTHFYFTPQTGCLQIAYDVCHLRDTLPAVQETDIVVYEVSEDWIQKCFFAIFLKPICSTLTLSSNLPFHDKEKLSDEYFRHASKIKATQSGKRTNALKNPKMYALSMDSFSDGGYSLKKQSNYDIFDFRLILRMPGSKAHQGNDRPNHSLAFIPVGKLPAMLKSTDRKSQLSWLKVDIDDFLKEDGYMSVPKTSVIERSTERSHLFLPTKIKIPTTPNEPSLFSQLIFITGAITCCSSITPQEVDNISQISDLVFTRVVNVVKLGEAGYESENRFLSFIDVCSLRLGPTHYLAALGKDGKNIKIIGTCTSAESLEILFTFPLQAEANSIYSNPSNTHCILVETVRPANVGIRIIKSECILRKKSFDINDSYFFKLKDLELVFDICWQHNDNQFKDSELESVNCDERYILLAILTNFRIIITDSNFKIVTIISTFGHPRYYHESENQFPFSISGSRRHTNSGKVSSIYWLGFVLVITFESGYVKYITCKKKSVSRCKLSKFHEASQLRRSSGVKLSGDDQVKQWFQLPRNISPTLPRSVIVITLSPEYAIIFSYSRNLSKTESNIKLRCTLRAIELFEPFIAGNLAYSMWDCCRSTDELLRYFAYLRSSVSNGSNLEKSSSSILNTVCSRYFLNDCFQSLAQLETLKEVKLRPLLLLFAKELATFTLCKDSHQFGRWIGTGVVAWLMASSYDSVASLSVVFGDAVSYLSEILHGNESFIGENTAIFGSSISSRLSSFGVALHKFENLNTLLRIFEIAGSSESIFYLLKNKIKNWDSFKTEVNKLHIRDLVSDLVAFKLLRVSCGSETFADIKFLNNFTESKRSGKLRFCGNIVDTNESVERKIEENTGSSLFSKFESITKTQGSSFNSKLKLSLDQIENYMASHHCLNILGDETYDVINGGIDFAGKQGSAYFDELELPVSWIANVGTGKELDRLVGYYRFSDAIFEKEVGFLSSSRPFSRLVFLDLSRYEGVLEFFSESSSVFTVEHSQSNINPGERHESTKTICDLVYTGVETSDSVINRGLRLVVRRGSQLDVGLYHVDESRNKLTIEFTVNFGATKESWMGVLAQNIAVLIQRCHINLDKPPTCNLDSCIWCLFFDCDGVLCFGQKDSSSILRTSFNIMSDSSCESNYENNLYHHVAFTIDSTRSNCFLQSSDNKNTIVPGSSVVSISVDGAIVLNQNIFKAPAISDTNLETTTIFIMPNFPVPYRFTELRIWADIRSEKDLINQKENCLGLAEKRIRLQLQLKGTKKLFSAFRQIEIPASCNKIIDSSEVAETSTLVESTGLSVISAPKTLFSNKSNFPVNANNSGMTAKERRLLAMKSGGKSANLANKVSTDGQSHEGGRVLSLDAPKIVRDINNETIEISKKFLIPTYIKILNLVELGSKLEYDDLVKCSQRTRFISSPGHGTAVVQCKDGHTEVEILSAIEFCKSDLGNVSFLKVSLDGRLSHVKFAAMAPCGSKAQHFTIALQTDTSISIAHLDSKMTEGEYLKASILTSLPMASTPLVYFTFLAPELMCLVTHTEGFTWRTTPNSAGGRYDPIKILKRVDIKPNDSWQSRVVVDLCVSPERWTMIVTKSNSKSDRESDIVSLHHAKSNKVVSFYACAGCFKSPDQVILALHLADSNDSTRSGWKLVVLDLGQLLDSDFSGQQKFSEHSYFEPFQFSDLSVSLQHALVTVFELSDGSISSHASFFTYVYYIADRIFLLTNEGILFYVNTANAVGFVGYKALLSNTFSGDIVAASLDIWTDLSAPKLLVLASSNSSEMELVKAPLRDIVESILKDKLP